MSDISTIAVPPARRYAAFRSLVDVPNVRRSLLPRVAASIRVLFASRARFVLYEFYTKQGALKGLLFVFGIRNGIHRCFSTHIV